MNKERKNCSNVKWHVYRGSFKSSCVILDILHAYLLTIVLRLNSIIQILTKEQATSTSQTDHLGFIKEIDKKREFKQTRL